GGDATPHRRPVPGESRGPHPLLLPEQGLPGRRPGLPREAQAPMARTLSAILTVLLLSGGAAPAQERSLTLPQGFRIEEFASGFGSTRFMTVDPAGTLLVSTPDQGRVVALPDRNRDGRADAAVMVADGLELPHGLAFWGGDLYIAETGRVKRFRYDPATLRARDWRGDDLPPDYITEVKEGAFYGWPECFAAGGRVVPDSRARTSAERCRQMTLPTIEIQAHSAPLGLAFYTGAQFPPSY